MSVNIPCALRWRGRVGSLFPFVSSRCPGGQYNLWPTRKRTPESAPLLRSLLPPGRWFAPLVAVLFAVVPCQSAECAKNIVLMISDGAGFNTFHAASYFEHGQLGKQPYDRFPVQLACTTDMLNFVDAGGQPLRAPRDGSVPGEAAGARPQLYDPHAMWNDFTYVMGRNDYLAFTDSAAAATALYTGWKTTDGRLGLDWSGSRELTSIAQIAHALGKASGVVTSVQASHATPAAMWSHEPSRRNYPAIFHKMLFHSGLDVIMGAGHPYYGDDGQLQHDDEGKPKPQKDGADYVGGWDTWNALAAGHTPRNLAFIESRADFERLARAKRDLPAGVVGIAQVHTTLQYNRPGTAWQAEDSLNDNVPSLATMSLAALNVLSRNPKGFVLMIEGGAVDWANHGNNLMRMLDEQVDFNRAVAAVVDWIEANGGWDETLLIVTSDHECGMLWGPGTYTDTGGNGRFDPETDEFLGWNPIENRGRGRLPGAQYASRNHSNVLVPLWANGPGAALFEQRVGGVDAKAGELWGFDGRYVDNTDVFTVMRAAIAPAIVSPAARPVNEPSAQPATAP